ncbi:Alpha/Beta hydrolase protein [Collybia nuda]|uniref:Alpha/Beta hydrolase protein n=1 Tax=Collybia nuda TaxID=64659 RepID=A0A9P6C8E3_9AGAR|nr:Alpha/Beta hydrolase protein [Collybia nuda]
MNFFVLATLFSALFITGSYAMVAESPLSLATRTTTPLVPSKRILNMCPTSSPVPEAIDGVQYSSLVKYYMYAYAANSDKCTNQNSNLKTFVNQNRVISSFGRGYIAIDTVGKEYIVAFRGKTTLNVIRDDPYTRFSSFTISGVTMPAGIKVHMGFRDSYFANKIDRFLLDFLTAELAKNRDYSIVTTGHSLGGALASISGVILKEKLKVPIRIYTFGQPRTGNKQYVEWMEKSVGRDNIFRSVSVDDPIPQFPTRKQGYMHHGVEYWTCGDGDSEADTRKCNLPEQPNCSQSITTPDPQIDMGPHLHYFGVPEDIEVCEQRLP